MSKLVYILAASHSGSTLQAMLLGAHPELCTVGELKATALGDPDRYRCSCRQLIRECPFWLTVREAMGRRGFDFDITAAGTDLRSGSTPYIQRLLRPLHRSPILEHLRDAALALSPTWRRNWPEIQARNLALIASLLEITGAKAIVDSSKIGLRLKYLLRIPELEVRVIRLVRDGRAVAAAYARPQELADASNPALRGGGSGTQFVEAGRPIEVGAREWLRCNQEAEQLIRTLPRDHWTQVRYEDLCADPAGVLRRLAQFLGVAEEYRYGDFRERVKHAIGNGMRFDERSEIRLDERWREALSKTDLAIFDQVAGRLNREYGYE